LIPDVVTLFLPSFLPLYFIKLKIKKEERIGLFFLSQNIAVKINPVERENYN